MFLERIKAKYEQNDVSGYGTSGISVYAYLTVSGKFAVLSFYFSGDVASNNAILTLPAGFRPKTAAKGIGMMLLNGSPAPAIFSIATDGKVYDSTTSGTKNRGSGTIAYILD